jgi:hypothetical protein
MFDSRPSDGPMELFFFDFNVSHEMPGMSNTSAGAIKGMREAFTLLFLMDEGVPEKMSRQEVFV